MGRKAIPIETKRAKGTLKKERIKNVPETSDKLPVRPAWLNKRAKQLFFHMTGRLQELNIASRTNTEALALLAFNMERVERFSKYLDQYGYTYSQLRINGTGENQTQYEVIKNRPEVQFLKEADRRVHALLIEFGLTPSSIQKIGTKQPKKKNSEFEGF